MENNYTVYQHVTPDGMYYFGTTQNVERRWEGNGRLYKTTALQPYIEKYGWDNIQHIVLFENQTKENALSIEDSLIISGWEKGNCINKQRSGLVSKEEGYSREYYEQNKEQIREYKQEYYETNKEQIREYQQEYYETKKEQIREKQQQYYETNKEQIREQKQQYYEQNKEQRREYQRQYYQRKKEEQQLKELGCLPLW